MPYELTHDTFARQLNTLFRVESRGVVMLELVEASEVRSSHGAESFSILFRGPSDAFLAQAMYRFHHDVLGAFDLFIVPIRKDTYGFYYEAVFNHMRRKGQQ